MRREGGGGSYPANQRREHEVLQQRAEHVAVHVFQSHGAFALLFQRVRGEKQQSLAVRERTRGGG